MLSFRKLFAPLLHTAIIGLGVSIGAVPSQPEEAPAPKAKEEAAPKPKPTPVAPVVNPLVAGKPKLTHNSPQKWMVELNVSNVPKGYAGPIWDVTPEDDDSQFRIIKSEKAVLLAGKKGQYRVKVRLVSGDDVIDLRDTVELTGDPTPIPPVPVPPGPGPIPPQPPIPPTPPVPTPSGKIARVVFYEDSSKAQAWRGDLFGSVLVQSHFKTGGLSHTVITTGTEGPDGTLDPEATRFRGLAAGKELPYFWALDAAGTVLKEGKVPQTDKDLVAVLDLGSRVNTGDRAMGNLDPGEKVRYQWKTFGDAPNVPLIPRGNWKQVSLANFLGPVHDQDGRGQCNASATCSGVEACRFQAGLPYVYLSGGDLYSQINGGRDQGSMLEDGLAASIQNGVAPVSLVPYVWDGRNHGREQQVVAERKKYRVIEAYNCPNFDAMASALQQGFFIIEGLMWYNNFTPDRDGWLPSSGRGGGGGHALLGYGLAQRGNTWGIMTRNSWSEKWGVNGNCIIPESLFGRSIGGYWAIRSVVRTPDVKTSLRINPFAREREFALAP